jgi:hypothetical protein
VLNVVFITGKRGKQDRTTQQQIQVNFCRLVVFSLSDLEYMTELATMYITILRTSRLWNAWT